MSNESSIEFLSRLRKKAKKHKDELSYAEETYLKVLDKADEEAVLGEGSGTKL